jgi:hypothetical protein
MAITLSGDGISSDAIASLAASKLTGTLPDANAVSGSVIQVVNGFTSAAVTTSVTNTYIDTGITATITPKFATSKIMVLVNICGMHRATGNEWNRMGIRILRGATVLGIEGLGQIWTRTSMEFRNAGAMYSKLDSPSSTSALVYKVQFMAEPLSADAGLTVQRDGNSGESQIFLMEIAA